MQTVLIEASHRLTSKLKALEEKKNKKKGRASLQEKTLFFEEVSRPFRGLGR